MRCVKTYWLFWTFQTPHTLLHKQYYHHQTDLWFLPLITHQISFIYHLLNLIMSINHYLYFLLYFILTFSCIFFQHIWVLYFAIRMKAYNVIISYTVQLWLLFKNVISFCLNSTVQQHITAKFGDVFYEPPGIYTGWAKKPDCFWYQITLQRIMIKRLSPGVDENLQLIHEPGTLECDSVVNGMHGTPSCLNTKLLFEKQRIAGSKPCSSTFSQ